VDRTVTPGRICHVFSTFGLGGPELRTVDIINALGPRYSHAIMPVDSSYDAAARLQSALSVRRVEPPPGKGSLLYSLSLGSALKRVAPDLVVTYNWGAIDAVLGARLRLRCPVVHVEDGLLYEEVASLKPRRVLLRRMVLRGAFATVVPSRTLERIAVNEYRVSPRKVIRIPNGVDTTRFRPRSNGAWRRSLQIPDCAVVLGWVGGLRPEKDVALLLRAFASAKLPRAWLVIVGDGTSRAAAESLTHGLGIGERVRFVGQALDPAPLYGGFDAFVASSATEQMPIALLEAMASGLPVVCTDVGDVRDMLPAAQHRLLAPPGDAARYSQALMALVEDAALRARLGSANRAHCVARYSHDRMVQRWASLYDTALASRRLRPARFQRG
jgi:glycosyltransferase involved in cell wall biosynthesis